MQPSWIRKLGSNSAFVTTELPYSMTEAHASYKHRMNN